MTKCKYYNHWQWVEPPLEPGDGGTLINEWECKKAKGYFIATCLGKRKNCNLPNITSLRRRRCSSKINK